MGFSLFGCVRVLCVEIFSFFSMGLVKLGFIGLLSFLGSFFGLFGLFFVKLDWAFFLYFSMAWLICFGLYFVSDLDFLNLGWAF